MMIQIDGSTGEGGGQILRTSLSLSTITGKSFRMVNIRSKRTKPGLMRQHLCAVNAAAQVCHGDVRGAEVGSQDLTFVPSKVLSGKHHFAVGTAGSTTLVFQTVLPALMTADGPSELVLEGGTHNPLAPPFEFLEKSFLGILNRIGFRVSVQLKRYGFYPAGGGKFTAEIHPSKEIKPIEIPERGKILQQRARVLVSNLPTSIAQREVAVLKKKTSLDDSQATIIDIEDSSGPGNIIILEVESEQVTEVIAGFGEHGVRAEAVAEKVVQQLRRYLSTGVPVGEHLADQLLLPLALAGKGMFRSLPLSGHSRTNMEIIEKFLPVKFSIREESDAQHVVEVCAAE